MNVISNAIKAGDVERVRELLGERPELAEQRDESGVSPLMLAHYYGGAAADAIRAARTSPLDVFEAATVGDVEHLRELLDRDPSLLSARSPDGATALHFAAFFGRTEAVRLLLARGAPLGAVAAAFGDVQPLHSAVASGNRETALAVLEAGADADARQAGGFTPLHGAAQNGDRELVEALLARGADAAAVTDEGKSAADFAAEGGHEELAELLRVEA